MSVRITQFGSATVPASQSPDRDTASVLRALRADRAGDEQAAFQRLGLDALDCVLARREGRAPSSAGIHRYMEALANNIPLRRVLLDAAHALDTANVRAIVYKGQDYLERIYGDPGARSMADVDLLVRERDLGRAERALLGAGFIADSACKLMHERKFCKGGVAIDLHHALLQAARMEIDHEELFARALPSSIAKGLFALEDTDALLVHCVNQTVKGYCLPASSYIELQALLARADMPTALERAVRYQMLSSIYTSLTAIAALGHEGAAAWAKRVPLPTSRKRALDAIVVRFALASLQREPKSRATMLALKATLIDKPLAVLRFVPQWAFWQTPFKPPRSLIRDEASSGEPSEGNAVPWQAKTTSIGREGNSFASRSTQRPSC